MKKREGKAKIGRGRVVERENICLLPKVIRHALRDLNWFPLVQAKCKWHVQKKKKLPQTIH